MTHLFIVNKDTFKIHLEYLFAGTGNKEKTVPFLINSEVRLHQSTERSLVGMIADISKIRQGDNIIFYVESTAGKEGMFYGVFKAASSPFFDENDEDNYLKEELGRALTFRVLIEPDRVFPFGVSEHEYLDSLEGKEKPQDLCWSIIYRKLTGMRGCTMIFDYEFEDLVRKLENKNNHKILVTEGFTFNSNNLEIVGTDLVNNYHGRRDSLSIYPRLVHKIRKKQAFETHLQAYIIQTINESPSNKLLLESSSKPYYFGNEVIAGFGNQKIDLLVVEEKDNDVFIRVIELKSVAPTLDIIDRQIVWYLRWVIDYIVPKFQHLKIFLIPTVIAYGELGNIENQYRNFQFKNKRVSTLPLEYYNVSYENSYFDIIKLL